MDEAAYAEYERIGPLWMRVEDALGEEEPIKTGLCRAASNWLRLQEVITTHHRRAEFDATLTPSQQKSWDLLSDWWEGCYQSEDLSKVAQEYIRAAASQVSSGEPSVEGSYPGTDKSFYHSCMFALFELEFHPHAIDFTPQNTMRNENYMALSDFYENLDSTRQLALAHAASQKIAFSCLNTENISAAITRRHLSGTLHSCSWLSPPSREVGMPYFLWDIAAKRTVVTKELVTSPKYTCISHTWGRWRIKNQSVKMNGVPWAVPVNTRFQVVNLPEIFCQVRWQTQYLWFDLFCIPQDGSKLANDEISRQAGIFRNSESSVAWLNDVETWNVVSNSITWLALTYLRYTSLEGLYETESALESCFQASNQGIELFIHAQELAADNTKHPPLSQHWYRRRFYQGKKAGHQSQLACSGWFSSLWTLQEACLCPDLFLFSKHWEPLKDKSGTMITLDTLFQLENNARKHFEYSTIPGSSFSAPRAYVAERAMQITLQEFNFSEQRKKYWPLGAQELRQLAIETKIDNLWDATPTGVLVLGNLRQCSESRAQAIMSVVGSTDWFTQYLNQKGTSPPEDNLVLGMYPHDFVSEVAQKLGGPFYCTMKSTPTHLRALWTGQALGSMLPFSTPQFRPSTISMSSSLETNEDHPALNSWEIQNSGMIRIRVAGILASSRNTIAKIIQAWVIMNQGHNSTFERVSLTEYLRQQLKSYHWYAIALCRNKTMMSGIILKTPRIRVRPRLYLIKVGYFRTLEREFPDSTPVNWLVL